MRTGRRPRRKRGRVPVFRCPKGGCESGGTDALYAWGSGTSGATVWVSGAIAHLLEHRPDLGQNGSSGGSQNTVEDVTQWIRESVVPQDGQSGHDEYYGYGRLRVDALLSMAS